MKLQDFENTEAVSKLLGGYSFDLEATGTVALQDAEGMNSTADAVVEIIEEFVRVETMFDEKHMVLQRKACKSAIYLIWKHEICAIFQ